MAFDLDNWDKLSGAANISVVTVWSYFSSTDNTATCIAANYFDNIAYALKIADQIFINASDGPSNVVVTAVSPNVTVAAESDAPADSITNTQINSAAAIAFSKLAALPSTQILVGSAGNVPTAVAVTGDVTVGNTGVTAIGASKVLSSMMSPLLLKYTTVAITAAEFNGMYAAPKLLLAAGGANTLIVPVEVQLVMTYGAAQFASGGVVAVQYDSTANGAGVIASSTQAAANFQDAASTVVNFNAGIVKLPFSTTVNKGLYLSNITGAFTTGDSTFVAHILYRVIPTA